MPEFAPSPADVIAAFTTAAQTALSELTQFESFADDAPDDSAADLPGEMLTATVRLQRNIPGAMTLILPITTAEKLAARYLPAGTDLTAEIIDDVAGEFANVIAGQAKTMLKGTPFHFTLSTPGVARGANVSLLLRAATMRVSTLSFEAGRLLLFLDLPPCPGA